MIMEKWSALSSGSLSVALFMTVWSKMMERTSAASAYPSVKYSGSRRCCEKHMGGCIVLVTNNCAIRAASHDG